MRAANESYALKMNIIVILSSNSNRNTQIAGAEIRFQCIMWTESMRMIILKKSFKNILLSGFVWAFSSKFWLALEMYGFGNFCFWMNYVKGEGSQRLPITENTQLTCLKSTSDLQKDIIENRAFESRTEGQPY